MAQVIPSTLPSKDFVTTSIQDVGGITAVATTMTLQTGLNLPATNGIIQINYDSTNAIGATDGPETVQYAAYTSGTGAVTGMTRGLAGTTGVTHSQGKSVQLGPSTVYWQDYSTSLGVIQPSTAWATFTPGTYTPNASTYTSTSTNFARYCQIGKVVHFEISFTGTTGGAVTTVYFTAPVVPKNAASGKMVTGGAWVVDTGSNGPGAWYCDNSSGHIYIAKGNWQASGTGTVSYHAAGSYEVA